MLIRVLGPLEVNGPTGWCRVAAPKQRALLGILVAARGATVSTDRLIQELWGEKPPAKPVNRIHVLVLQVRRALGDSAAARLRTVEPGYQLELASDETDAGQFEKLAAEGLTTGNLEDVSRALREALDLWRGEAYSDVPSTEPTVAESSRLAECRLVARETRFDVGLRLGEHAILVPELQAIVEQHPFRERFWTQLMLALYRSRRQAEALRAYQQIFHLLDDELGVAPDQALRDLHQQILLDDPDLQLPVLPISQSEPLKEEPTRRGEDARSQPAEVHQLPPDIHDFVGREKILAELDDARRGSARSVVLSGYGGIGKTALAIHWGCRSAEHFRDGELYVDLRGHAGTEPMQPGDALGRFLRALGVEPDRVPTESDEAAALYRSLLSGREMLILLDNASTADQVQSLLPARPGCFVLVTSRNRLDGLVARASAHRIDLERLSTEESVELMATIAGRDQLSEAPDIATEIAALCGGSPLAVRLAAANLAADPEMSPGMLAAQLRGDDRLSALRIDGERDSVRTAFDLSYEKLDSESARVFRLLGLFPGESFDVSCAAALTGNESVARVLRLLINRNLLLRIGQDRYTFHDLIRLYASAICHEHDLTVVRQDSTNHLLDWYLTRSVAAARQIYPDRNWPPGTNPSEDPLFPDAASAWTWHNVERGNFAPIVRQAAAMPGSVTWRLADALRTFFHRTSDCTAWKPIAQLAYRAATESNDLLGQAVSAFGLLSCYRNVGEYGKGEKIGRQALQLCETVDWPAGVFSGQIELALLYLEHGRPALADGYLRSSVQHAESARERCMALETLGWVEYQTGQLVPLVEHLHEVLALQEHRPDDPLHAGTQLNLAGVNLLLGEFDECRRRMDSAVPVIRRSKFLPSVVLALFGRVCLEVEERHYEIAREVAAELLDITQEHATPIMRAMAFIASSFAWLDSDPEAARQAAEDGLSLCVHAGDDYDTVVALIALAKAQHRVGDNTSAGQTVSKALAHAHEHGFRVLEGQAFTERARIQQACGDLETATDTARQALALHRATGHRPGETATLQLLADLAPTARSCQKAV